MTIWYHFSLLLALAVCLSRTVSGLAEQYERGWYDLTYGPSKMQAADILAKLFSSAEKWRFALALLSHIKCLGRSIFKKLQLASPSEPQPQALASSRSSGGPEAGLTPQRLMVEICGGPNSKLSDVSRKSADGCRVIQSTEKHSLLDEHYRQYVADVVNEFPKNRKVLLWLSLYPARGAHHGLMST